MKNLNLSRSREKEAPAEQAFTFPGAIPTKSKVRSTAATKWLDFGGEEIDKFEFEGENMMEWINILGAVFIAVIMVPNIIFTLKCKDGFENKWNNKGVEVVEQIGRFGCFGFMVVNIPGTWFGWWSDEAFAIYLIVNVVLIILYCVIWIICFRNNTIFKALTLSIIPSVIFIFSGIMSRSVLLIVASLLFAPAHILISYKNAKY